MHGTPGTQGTAGRLAPASGSRKAAPRALLAEGAREGRLKGRCSVPDSTGTSKARTLVTAGSPPEPGNTTADTPRPTPTHGESGDTDLLSPEPPQPPPNAEGSEAQSAASPAPDTQAPAPRDEAPPTQAPPRKPKPRPGYSSPLESQAPPPRAELYEL
ncbi:hypothetical protein NDU88_000010 [Pleurodeles waltl]|uniref:Uncharacterized protein n=1 Tax=Pleurodeles waltl TaxID=8319 RepID=A0AAV7MFN0_PLEWA|nr:hypothetical protein NDU88_000010 [Pleurodeles waltl]